MKSILIQCSNMLDGCESRGFSDISEANEDCDYVTAGCRRREVMRAVGEIGSNKMEGINKTTGATTDGPKLSLTGVWLKVVVLAVFIAPMAAQTPGPEAPAVFTLSVPKEPITGWSGSSVVLPCEVSPLFNAEPLEVRWYRAGNFKNPALFYKDHKIQETPVDPRYKGRVSLTGGLERGNVSLNLERFTEADIGEYVCYVISEWWYETANVFLTIGVTGTVPVLSVTEGGGGQVNVTCDSEGWSPQPTLTWKNKAGTQVRPGGGMNHADPQGLVSVSSWLLYSPSDSDWLSCTVSLSEEERRESRVTPWICNPGAWSLVAFIVTLVLSLVIICGLASVILYKQRGPKTNQQNSSVVEGVNPEGGTELRKTSAESTHLLKGPKTSQQNSSVEEGVNPEDWHQAEKNQVTVTMDEKTAPPGIIVSDGTIVRFDKAKYEEDNSSSKKHPHVLCKQSFRSGQHYWEVKVRNRMMDKQSWYVGVAREKADKRSTVSLIPEHGFWILSYEKQTGLKANTDPPTPVPGGEGLYIVGVFLDCDRHTLSFYNVDTKSHLYTFTDVLTRNNFQSVFSPGQLDSQNIHIMNK